MNKKLLPLILLFSNILFSQTIIDFEGQNFSEPGYQIIGNTFEVSGFKFSCTPYELRGESGGLSGTNGNSLVLWREGYSFILTLESINGENFNLESFYFGTVDDNQITHIEGFEDNNSVGIQNSGFTQMGTQILNSTFANVDKIIITVEAVDNFSNVFGALDDFVIKSPVTLSYNEISSSNNINHNKIFFQDGKFKAQNLNSTLKIFSIVGQRMLNKNLPTGLYIIEVKDNFGNANRLIKIAK